jgi:hypothetical protein
MGGAFIPTKRALTDGWWSLLDRLSPAEREQWRGKPITLENYQALRLAVFPNLADPAPDCDCNGAHDAPGCKCGQSTDPKNIPF